MSDFDKVEEALDAIINEMKGYDFDISYGERKEVDIEGENRKIIELIHNPTEKVFFVPLELEFFNEKVGNVTGHDVMRAMIFENLWHQRHKRWPWEEEEDPRDESLLKIYEKNPDMGE